MRRISLVAGSVAVFLTAGSLVATAQEPQVADPLGFASRPASLRVNQQDNMSVRNHFRVGPARHILTLAPGSGATVDISVLNLQGKDSLYILSSEDYAADSSQQGSAKFYGSETDGPYPARLWMRPEVTRLPLHHGEKGFVRIHVLVPRDAEPGDHQAAIMVQESGTDEQQGGFKVLSRVAALFIVTVEGDISEDTRIVRLRPRYALNWSSPITLLLSGRNDGTVHSIPYGTIEIRNIFGAVVDEIPVQNWVLLRNSEKEREFNWEPKFALGYYKATANLSLSSSVGESLAVPVSTGFWVVPLLPVLLVLLGVFTASFLVQYFFSRFEIQKKERNNMKKAPKKAKK
ncbi:hypothetical protein COU78_07035 [Candidatus Peregrinibacteria bacterium CG10_big_fil_rev_8_21_14_0_10_49_24]|nr:MAG: hypothetical protein COV83_05905 [Candidatus Peregrinibacteria bacterium CG11_big_fil_rev_8_21_14_0_20_49_14]PIR50356.1 MAG: hypothetical protein COU78_07035 [Candidatus Peregrinibacteria bacterium CG10_big_fil_rev_8_21_14_0_10_49_24]PJA67764.1 MAG: hypothetical protein CO157_02745 [Candidatus Peregrinibacteria bacterium CG_4_9_14_3_um_filter_49_12]